MNRQSLKVLLISTLVVTALAFGSSVTIPYSFTTGGLARASELNANFAAVETAVDDNAAQLVALKAARVYTAPSLFTGWANVGSGYAAAGYTKDGLGFVRLRGLIKQTGGTGNVFSLPVGYRPSANLQFPARCGNSTMCAIIINSNGNVDFYGGAGAAGASLTLDGITFDPQ